MSDFMSRASLAGAVDLSSLRKPESAPVAATSAPNSMSTNVGEILKMPSLTAQGNETNMRNFVEVSNHLPVIIEFYAGWSEQSKALSPKLTKLVEAFSGRIFLLQIELDSNINVAKAFKVGSAPTVLALLRGQPVPLFEGDQPKENVKIVFDRVLEIALENGMNGVIEIDEQKGELPVIPLPPRHQAAFDAIDAGNYAEAANQYELALNENPADSVASSGLAQARLLMRTDGIDFEKAIGTAPGSLAEVLLKADACMAVGHSAQAFSTILTRFATVYGEEREVLRKHLLELFLICPPEQPELADARRQLAALLY